jgi:PAS domain-containing protein
MAPCSLRSINPTISCGARWSVRRSTGLRRKQIERKRAEEELRLSEAYLAEAQRLSKTGSFGWGVSSGEIFCSEETFRIFGYVEAPSASIDMILQRVNPDGRYQVCTTATPEDAIAISQ